MSLGRALLMLQRLDAQLPRPHRCDRQQDPVIHPWGITEQVFARWAARRGLCLPLTEITRDIAFDFLHEHFWLPTHCHELPWPLSVAQLACALHTGVASALRVLRRASLLVSMGPMLAATVTAPAARFEAALTDDELAAIVALPVVPLLYAMLTARMDWLAEIADRDASQRGPFEHWIVSIQRLAAVLGEGADVGSLPEARECSGPALIAALAM